MTSPTVSILLLTYNQQGTIARAIESVLAQRCDFEVEIILADDCSSDDTVAICRRYAEANPSIRLIVNARNKGLVDNYYDCLLEARGKYIADCAGDDYWVDPERLAKQVAIMEQHPEVEVVHADWRYVDAKTGATSVPRSRSGVMVHRQALEHGRDVIASLLSAANAPAPTIMLSTAIYRRASAMEIYNREPELLRSADYPCEDLQLLCALLYRGDLAFVPDVALHYSVGQTSISSTEDYAKTFRFYYGTTLLRLRLIERFDIHDSRVDRYMSHIAHYLLMQAYHGLLPEQRDMAAKLMHDHAIARSLKTRIISLITSIKPLWRLMVRR